MFKQRKALMLSVIFSLFLSLFFQLAYSSETCPAQDESCPVKNDICPIDNDYFDAFLGCSAFFLTGPVIDGDWNRHIEQAIEFCELDSGIGSAFDGFFHSANFYLNRLNQNNEFEGTEPETREFNASINQGVELIKKFMSFEFFDIYEFGAPIMGIEDWSDGTWSNEDWNSENLYPVLDECLNKRDNILEEIHKMTWLNT